MSRHTPGPWTYDEDPACNGRIFIVPVGDPCLYLADILSKKQDPEGRYPTRGERLKNAALMATSPKMLAFLVDLKDAFPALDNPDEPESGADAVEKLADRWETLKQLIYEAKGMPL